MSGKVPTGAYSIRKTELRKRHEVFVQEYATHFNASKATIAAGYSPKAATEMGVKLLKQERVQKLLGDELARRREKLGITADEVLRRISAIATYDPIDLVDWGTRAGVDVEIKGAFILLKNAKEIPPNIRQVVQSVEATQAGIKLRLCDRLKALEMLGKYHGLFVDKHEHSGPGGAPLNAQVVITLPHNGRESVPDGG